MQLGYGGMKIAGAISGLSQPTLRKARQELENGQVDWDCQRQRRAGGGRKRIEQTHPDILDNLKKLIEDETAGDGGAITLQAMNGLGMVYLCRCYYGEAEELLAGALAATSFDPRALPS